jgi:hypothetical protein
MKYIKLFEQFTLLQETLQLIPDSQVMPKVAEIAKELNIYLVPQITTNDDFMKKVDSLKGNFNIQGVDYLAIIAHTGLPSTVQLRCYSKSDAPNSFKLIKNFYEVLKKEFSSIEFKDYYSSRKEYEVDGNKVEVGLAVIDNFCK